MLILGIDTISDINGLYLVNLNPIIIQVSFTIKGREIVADWHLSVNI